LILAR